MNMKQVTLVLCLSICQLSFLSPGDNILFTGVPKTNQSKPTLTLSQVERLVKIKAPDETVAGEIKERGVGFTVDDNTIATLRRLGAGPKTVSALLAVRPASLDALPLRAFEFDVVTIDSSGSETSHSKGKAQSRTEDTAGIALELVLIPGGTFLMGSSKSSESEAITAGAYNENDYYTEKPPHQVTVESFYIGKYEVTQAQWRIVAGLPKVARDLNRDPSRFIDDKFPVERVSWDDAMEFCARLSHATRRSYRMPTEAEWEYACRGGTTTPFAFGQTITPQLVNYDGNHPLYKQAEKGKYLRRTMEVGSMGVANGFGLFDMHGNVSEWCLDYWHKNYDGATTDGSSWETAGDSRNRVRRGGAWPFHAETCRSARRAEDPPNFSADYIGFRVAIARTP